MPERLVSPDRRSVLVQADGDVALVTVPGVARFLAHRAGDIVVDAVPGATHADIECFVEGPVATAGWALDGTFALRGAAVDVGGRAVVLTGPSAVGASTVAALVARHGHPVLSDRVVRLSGAGLALPTDRELRLWPDAIAALDLGSRPSRPVRARLDVRRVALAAAADPVPLAAVVVLRRDDTPPLHRRGLDGFTAAAMRVWHAALLDGPLDRARVFAWLTSALDGVPVVSLGITGALDRMVEAADDLVDAVAAVARADTGDHVDPSGAGAR